MSAPKKLQDVALIVAGILFACAIPAICLSLVFFTPILFFGKVVDEQGLPVSGATVEMSFCSNPGPGEGHSKKRIITDAEGLFFSWGFGLGVVVSASKEGFRILPASSASYSYVECAGKVEQHSSSKTRAILVLGSPEKKKLAGEKPQ